MSFDLFGDKDKDRYLKYQSSSFAASDNDQNTKPSTLDTAKGVAKNQAKKYVKKTIRDAAIANPEISIPI